LPVMRHRRLAVVTKRRRNSARVGLGRLHFAAGGSHKARRLV
jgi:hypothetical protein